MYYSMYAILSFLLVVWKQQKNLLSCTKSAANPADPCGLQPPMPDSSIAGLEIQHFFTFCALVHSLWKAMPLKLEMFLLQQLFAVPDSYCMVGEIYCSFCVNSTLRPNFPLPFRLYQSTVPCRLTQKVWGVNCTKTKSYRLRAVS